jgi:hypothetical protein
MENLSYAILILSILVQIAATILAMRLVWVTKKIGAWALVAMGITLEKDGNQPNHLIKG